MSSEGNSGELLHSMASVAVRRSPVFTPSPSDSSRKVMVQPAASVSKTPQRRRSLQSTQTLVGSALPAEAMNRSSSTEGGVSRASVAAEPRAGSPITPRQSARVAWGAAVTPLRLAHHLTAQPAQSLSQCQPEPEPEPSLPELLQPDSEPKPRPNQPPQPSFAEIRALFARMDKHSTGRVSSADLTRALQVDSELRSSLGLPASVGDAERRALQAEAEETGTHALSFALDGFFLHVVHHRLTYAKPDAGPVTTPARTAIMMKTPPRVKVQRNAVMQALRPVSAANAPARGRFSGLDTSFSNTWPWQDGVNTAWSELETQLIAAIAACLQPRDVVRAAGACCSWRRVILRRCQIDSAWAEMFTEKFGRLPRD